MILEIEVVRQSILVEVEITITTTTILETMATEVVEEDRMAQFKAIIIKILEPVLMVQI